jgi:hypothetical protein
MLRNISQGLGLGLIFGTTEAKENLAFGTSDNIKMELQGVGLEGGGHRLGSSGSG